MWHEMVSALAHADSPHSSASARRVTSMSHLRPPNAETESAFRANLVERPAQPEVATRFGPFDRNSIRCTDALNGLKSLPDNCIDLMITSPPYWALRDYGVNGQIGLEKDFRDYIAKLLAIFDEAKRVLKPHGTCWVNLGDTFAAP